MKKILVVLAMLFVCGMAFSVTGNVHARLDANGSVHTTEWGSLDDISMAGRSETGFSINFDSFGFNYLLRGDQTLPAYLSDAYVTTAGASSPGYFQITGLKLGNIGLGIGASFWHFDETKAEFATNGATTNTDLKANIAFNRFAVNAYFSIPLSDTMTLQQVPWDQMQLDIGFGSATRKDIGVTNDASDSLYVFDCPLYLNMSLDKLSLSIFDRLHINGNTDTENKLTATNSQAVNNFVNTTIVRIGYPLNDQWSIYAHVGVAIGSSSSVTKQVNTTNETTGSVMEIPILAGLKFQPAGWAVWNLGIGYVVANDVTTTKVSGTGASTNTVTTGGGLNNIYHNNNAEEHGYALPFMNYGGSAKFASDWTLAFTGQILLNSSASFSTSGYYVNTKTDGTAGGTVNDSQLVHFTHVWNWDGGGAGGGACYIQYAKDAVSLKFVMGSGGAASSIMGMFGFVDMQINF